MGMDREKKERKYVGENQGKKSLAPLTVNTS